MLRTISKTLRPAGARRLGLPALSSSPFSPSSPMVGGTASSPSTASSPRRSFRVQSGGAPFRVRTGGPYSANMVATSATEPRYDTAAGDALGTATGGANAGPSSSQSPWELAAKSGATPAPFTIPPSATLSTRVRKSPFFERTLEHEHGPPEFTVCKSSEVRVVRVCVCVCACVCVRAWVVE